MNPAPPLEFEKPKRKRVWKVLGWIVIAIALVAGLVYFFGIEFYRRVVSSIDFHYNVAFAAQMYANDFDGQYPPLSSEPGRLMYSPEVFIGRDIISYVDSWTYRGEPGTPGAFLPELPNVEAAQAIYDFVNDQSYYYLGYAVTNEIEGRAFIRAYRDTISRSGNFEEDLAVPKGEGNFGGDRLLRLRENMVEYLVNERKMPDMDARRWESEVVFLLSNPRKRQKSFFPPKDYSRGLVAYLDGHTDVQKIPGDFPYTEEFLSALEDIDRMSDNGPPERPSR